MLGQIREILRADRAASAQGAAEDDDESSSRDSSRDGANAGTGQSSGSRMEGITALPDQATALRRSSSDSWRSADSQLDVDTDSDGGLSKEGLSNDDASPASSSGSALAQSAEPKEVEVVKQESSYRPIMWCVPAAVVLHSCRITLTCFSFLSSLWRCCSCWFYHGVLSTR